jgi:hypothetical protein
MANQTGSNPEIYDTTTGAGWTGTRFVKSVQIVDDAGDIAADDIFIIVVNGTTLTVKVPAIDANVSTTHWEFGPFNKGIPWRDVTMTIPHGAVIVWYD